MGNQYRHLKNLQIGISLTPDEDTQTTYSKYNRFYTRKLERFQVFLHRIRIGYVCFAAIVHFVQLIYVS